MSVLIYLPKIPALDCGTDGNISQSQLSKYFTVLGQIPNQIRLQANGLDECSKELIIAAAAISVLVNDIPDALLTKVFNKIKSLEEEMRYRAKELGKEIETFIQKKVIDIILSIIGLLNIPNPFELPIPFLGTCILLDDNGLPYEFTPKVKDLFTKDGKTKIKACIAQKIDDIRAFFGVKRTFDGKLGIKAPEFEAEELWHKILNWLNKILNDFLGAVCNAIADLIKSIPIIGKPIYNLVTAAIDPTITVEEAFNQLVEEFETKIENAIDDVLSGRALENLANQIFDEAIDAVLSIPIPLLGTLGDLIGFDIRGKKVVSKESIWQDIKDEFKRLIEKVRRFFQGGLLIKIKEIILQAPAFILSQFPIVGKILDVLIKVADILAGKNPLSTCDVLNIILPPLFNLGTLVVAALPGCVEVEFTEYGLEPT